MVVGKCACGHMLEQHLEGRCALCTCKALEADPVQHHLKLLGEAIQAKIFSDLQPGAEGRHAKAFRELIRYEIRSYLKELVK